MLALLLILAAAEIPASVRQGEVFRVTTAAAAVSFREVRAPVFGGQALVPVPIDTPPGRHSIRLLDTSGATIEQHSIEVLDGGYPEQDIPVSGAMRALKASPGEREAVEKLKSLSTPARLWREPFTPPARGCMNSPYGVKRLHNGKPSGRYHLGLDQRGPAGTPVRAAADGVVRISRMFKLHGGTVGIDHGQGVTTMYIHLSKALAREGATVKAGQVIGQIGATGFATGPHLHWIVNVHGIPVNPMQWTPAIRPCGAQTTTKVAAPPPPR